MTNPLGSFHSSKVQSVSISKEKSSVLLDRSIKIFFRRKDFSVHFVEATIFEIFTRCQASLSDSFELCKFSIRGSSVAHIFSSEPYADVDIHGFIDLSKYSPSNVIRRGHEIKWRVLDAINRIVNEKLAMASPSQESLDSLEQIIFEDQFVPLGTKEVLPFNIHTLRLGSLPIEFTFFAIIHDDFSAQRFFDFNCGALELQIDSENVVSLHSPLPDMGVVLEEISRRELRCESPSQLFRKSICRYLSKVSISGYYDKDPALLPSFIANLKERKGALLDDDSMIQEIMKEIIGYFKSKDLDPSIGLINLYFSHAETSLLELLKEAAIRYLVLECSSCSNYHLQAIRHLITRNKLSECAWYFLCIAKKIHHVSHRSKECLQVEIPLATLFEGSGNVDKVFYVNLPLIDLWKLKAVECPAFFLRLLTRQNYFESYSKKAQLSLNVMLSHVLIKNRLGSLLSAVLNRLKIEVNEESSSLFLQQMADYRESMEEPLPFFVVHHALEYADIQSIATPKIALEIIRQVSLHVDPKEAVEFEASLKQPLIMQSIGMILKDDFLESIKEEERGIYLNFAKIYIEELIKKINGGYSPDLQFIKKIINISYLLYLKDVLPIDRALKGALLCFKNGLDPQGALYLKNIILKSDHITKEEVEPCFKTFIDQSLQDFLLYCFKNKQLIKEKLGGYVFELFFEKMRADNLEEPYLATFIEFYTFFLRQEEKEAFNLKVFQNAALKQPFYEKLYDSFNNVGLITLGEFKNISSPSNQEIVFLFMQDSYHDTILKDEAFARFFIDQCFSLNLYVELFYSVKLLLTDSCQNRQELFLFLSQLARMPHYFIEALQLFTSLSIDSFDINEQHAILNDMLFALDSALSCQKSGMSLLLNEDVMICIALLHKKYLKVTLKNPCWKKIWGMHSIVRKHCAASEWIDLNDIEYFVLKLNPYGLLQQFLSAFVYDYSFVCRYVYLVSSFDPIIQSVHNGVICDLLSDKSYAIFNEITFESDENVQAAAHTMQIALSLLRSFLKHPTTDEDIAKFMYLLLFTAAFGDFKVRNNLAIFLTSLSSYEETAFFAKIRSMGLLEEIFFTLCDHALKDNNLDEIKNISKLFKEMFIIEGSDGEAYAKTNFAQVFKVKQLMIDRCHAWHKFLKQLFNKQSFIDTLDDSHPAISALDYYIHFLTQVVVCVSHTFRTSEILVPSSEEGIYLKEIQSIHLSAISSLLDVLSAKKFVLSSQGAVHFLSLIGYLEQEEMRLFVNKFIFYAIQQIKSIEPASKHPEIQKAGFSLLRHATMFAAHIELKFEGLKDNRQIITLLETARSRLTCFTNDELLIDSDLLNTLSYVEGFLKPQEAIAYYENWLSSIVARRHSVTYDEINLFTIFTFRCDARFSKSIANGQNYKRFENKFFITPEFFKSPLLIRDMIHLFDIAFSRFYQHVDKESTNPMMMNLDIFSLFSVYGKNLNYSIETMKNRAEASKLQMQFIEVLSDVFEKPKSRLSFHVLQALWVYLIMVDVSGIFSFKNKSRDQIVKSVQAFHRLIERLKTLPDLFKIEHEVPYDQLIITYEYHKAAFSKTLTKAQNESIMEFLSLKVTESVIKATSPGQTSEAMADLGLFDERLFEEIQKDLMCNSDAIALAEVVVPQDKE